MKEVPNVYKETISRPEISFWVPIIVGVASAAASFAILTQRIGTLESRFDYFGGRFQDRVTFVDTKLEQINSDYNKIQVTLAEIQKDILFIRSTIEKVR